MKHKDLTNFTNLAFLIPILEFTGGYIAGGVFKNIFNKEKIKDVDVFFEKKEDFTNAQNQVKTLIGNSDNYSFVYQNENVYCYKDKRLNLNIELIQKDFSKPEDEIKTFDFTITKFAIYLDNSVDENARKLEKVKVIYHDDFFEHLQQKRLVIDGSPEELEYPLSTFNRVLKYTTYGYNLCRESKVKMIEAIHAIPGGTIIDEELGASLYNGKD